MSRFSEIQALIAKLPPNFKIEEVNLKDAYNHVLQEDVLADMDMPPFHKSAMDGYACHLEDIGEKLKVLEVVHAGMMPTKKVGKNECVKIMTGAVVPVACDCVFKVEDSERSNENQIICTNPKTAKNICYQGEDYQAGDILLKKGTIINVSHMAVLAGAGHTKVKVSVLPKIAVIATGSELVEPHKKPVPGQIRNSNASQLITQLRKMNLEVTINKLVSDDFEKLTQLFKQALIDNDIVFFTGGASIGDFDFIPEILKEQEFNIFWNTTGMKPGNPMSFSQKGNKYCFGLSGNPVSSLMQFEILAKPVLYKIMGANYNPLRISAKMEFDYARKKADRFGIVPVVIGDEGSIEAIPFHGSAHINALTFANALLEVPLGETIIKKGDLAYVRPL